jgi:ABC-type transport system substrate-binding protein
MLPFRDGISVVKAVLVIFLLVIAAVAFVLVATTGGPKQVSTTGSQTNVSTSASGSSSISTVTTASNTTRSASPSLFTYETFNTIGFLDPGVSFGVYDYNIMQNVYEPLLWYNGSCGTCVIPWLAQSYTQSSDLKTYNFTLRSGIQFADGEPLNSTAIYFAMNRLLLEDGSTPVSHGTQASFLLQQLLNTSLSTTLCTCTQTYDQKYMKAVLAQNFVEITGPLAFRIHVMNPSAAFAFLIAGDMNSIALAPNYVMQNDLSLWNSTNTGYKLPYPTLSGSLTNKINQYFQDEVATCDSGSTPSGCGTTYLDGSYPGSLAGTGPYTLQSNDKTTNNILLTANPHYWGGPYQFSGGEKIGPKITTVEFKFVPDQTTREIDLENAAKSGQAVSIDVSNTNLYDVADRTAWLNNNTLLSSLPGVTIYGPHAFYGTLFDPFNTNVTSYLTGQYYTFQPFADIRFRLAFADSINMTKINLSVNNKLAVVALNVVPPGLPPTGSYNPAIKPIYSYNPVAVQNLLLDAMRHPISKFRFTNGTLAPLRLFNNTFGCASLNANHQCNHPVPQSISVYFPTGDTLNEAILNQIAGVINNVSGIYNMGLTVAVVPSPSGQLLTLSTSIPTHVYMYGALWIFDYPWVTDFLGPMYAPSQTYPGPDGWNILQMRNLFRQSVRATSTGNITGVVAASDAMNRLANNMVMYLWTFYTTNFFTVTSNVHGFLYNPSLSTSGGGGVGPEYFATFY